MSGAGPRGDRATDGEAGPGRAAVAPAELARARRAYRRGLEAARAWRAFSPDPRHHDATYWTLIATLFAEPGMNRTRLVDRIVGEAGVSRSTAERAVREARASGLVVGEQAGGEVRLDLSDRLFDHCVGYFRAWMDAGRLGPALGHDEGYDG
jgi:hypothetical protein